MDIPKTVLKEIQRDINKFIAGNNRSSIKMNILYQNILYQQLEKRGLAVPNIQIYYVAALLVAIVDW